VSGERVLELLKEQFGVERLEFELREGGSGRYYAYRRCELEVEEFASGVYFGKLERQGFRLSVEGCYLVGRSAKRGVVEVSREQAERWMRGESIPCSGEGYVILRWGGYFLGCGRVKDGRVLNYLPKERRIP